MELILQQRAEIALRSLGQLERKQVAKALVKIQAATLDDLKQSPYFRPLRGASGEKLFVYRGGNRLRLVLSSQDDLLTVEDIIDRERLGRLLPDQGRQ